MLSLVLVGRGRGLTQQVADLAPGDRVHRYVDLVSGGSLAATALGLQVSAAPASPLTQDTGRSRGLRAQVALCDGGPWQPATGLCRGRVVELLPETGLSGLVAVRPLSAARLGPGAVLHLRLRLVLPDQEETTVSGVLPAGSVQGRRAALTWTFRTRQAP